MTSTSNCFLGKVAARIHPVVIHATWLGVTWCATGLPSRATAAQPPVESRDRDRLDDLDRPPSRDTSAAEAASPRGRDGEPNGDRGTGAPSRQHEGLEKVVRELSQKMLVAEQKLRAGEASGETQQLQQQVIDQLDQLIAVYESQLQPSQSSQESTGQANDGEQSAAGDQAGQAGNESGAGTDSREGTARGESGSGDDREGGVLRRDGDEVWGHLPERIRQQLQNAAVERFLPKYEDLIEAFYRRLAEEESSLRPRTTP